MNVSNYKCTDSLKNPNSIKPIITCLMQADSVGISINGCVCLCLHDSASPCGLWCCLSAVCCYRMRVIQHWCCRVDFSDMKPTSQGSSSPLCMDMNERVWSITISLFSDSASREEGFPAARLRMCVRVFKTHICVYRCTSVYVLTSVGINIIECCVKECWPLEISRRVETHALSSHQIDCDKG